MLKYKKKILIISFSNDLMIFSSEKAQINVYLFPCVVFGLISSPFLLHATVKHHTSKYDTFLRDLYNENSTFGFGTVSIVHDL